MDLAHIIFALQSRDRRKDLKRKFISAHQEPSLIELVLKIVILLVDSHSLVPTSARSSLLAMKQRLQLRSCEQASLLTMIMNNCDDSHIQISDLAKDYGVSTLEIANYLPELDDLALKNVIIRSRDSDGVSSYRITESVMRALRMGQLPARKDLSGLSTADFFEQADDLLIQFRNEELEAEPLKLAITELLNSNHQLPAVQYVKRHHLCYDDLLLLLAMTNLYLNDNDDAITHYDLSSYFSKRVLNNICRKLERGEHPLMQKGIVEYFCSAGQVDASAWKLTDGAKSAMLGETVQISSMQSKLLTRYDQITSKRLFFNKRVGAEVELLVSLMKPRRMSQIRKQLQKRGFRQGIACLFYGPPGTGKTETVLQLARSSRRDIFMVDVPSVRSKWVGDTEKNIKEIFVQYRRLAAEMPHAPILFFNEADALLNRRSEGATGSVDKMENAMQNIILQELEQLDGILIATTNLTSNLDPAFERRFLYKLQFDRPAATERMHIWRSLMPDLTKAQALDLAERYEFSGGQIENIARKRIVSDILMNRHGVDMDSILASCKGESINNHPCRAIGFGS